MFRKTRRSLVVLAVSGAAFLFTASTLTSQTRPTPGRINNVGTRSSLGERTAWGEPDLQGIWGLETDTPLERPQQYAGRDTLTDDERAAVNKQRSSPVKFKGKVTRIDWINPHMWIYVDVKKDDGTEEKWAVEAGGPTSLFRRGFNKDSVPVGAEVVIDGYQSKDGSNRANGGELVFADGRKMFFGSSGTGAPYELTSGAK